MTIVATLMSAMTATVLSLALTGAAAFADTIANPPTPVNAADEVWNGLVTDVFGGRPMQPGDGVIALEAPYRAEDAAIVPMTISARLPAGDTRWIRKITLVIDQNPAPVAAEYELGETDGIDRIETRVRVNAYTKVHAVAEASDGTLYMTETFVKASGGCSAPAGKDPQLALANLGKMKLNQFAPAGEQSGRREAQIMIRHPNNSGLQMDQVTRHYIPAWFVNDIAIRQGDDLIMRVTGGISLSEDPNLRFSYAGNGADRITVEATDTEGKAFSGAWAVEGSS